MTLTNNPKRKITNVVYLPEASGRFQDFLIKNQSTKKMEFKTIGRRVFKQNHLNPFSNAMSWSRLWIGYLIYNVAHSKRVTDDECNLSQTLVDEIHGHKGLVNDIISEATKGSYAGKFYKDLEDFTDKFGSRKTGTQGLDVAIKYLSNTLPERKLVTKLENVTVPMWVRGKEMAFFITSLRKKRLRIKALGFSGSGEVKGPLIIVKDIEQLQDKEKEVKGKIVLFNTEFKDYISTVVSRNHGPAAASHLGAVGVLVRSVTPFSLGSIHEGVTEFNEKKPIPAAAIALEDADLLSRLSEKGNVTIELSISNRNEPVRNISQNLIADIPGKSEPLHYITLSGHIDSWDVGQGALDDGGGAFLALHSLLLLKHMKIEPPRRTMRAILWTGEELGLYGAKAYAKAHSAELNNLTAAFESDEGLYEPLGFTLNGNIMASCILKEIASLFGKLNATEVERTDEVLPTGVSVFKPFNVPLLQPLLKQNNYFWYHHTDGDSMRAMNSTLMDRNLALTTGAAYILANLSISLPREPNRRSDSVFGQRKLLIHY